MNGLQLFLSIWKVLSQGRLHRFHMQAILKDEDTTCHAYAVPVGLAMKGA